MKIEKEKHNVKIHCLDGTVIKGNVHLNPGERIIDFLNDTKENFIAVTGLICQNLEELHSFRLAHKVCQKKDLVILNKEIIKFVEEI